MSQSYVPSAYNKFINLDGLEDRIIYYLISENGKTKEELEQVHIIWKLLYYNDYNALNEELPTEKDIRNLVSGGESDLEGEDYEKALQSKRIFRSPHFEDGWLQQCTMMKIYIDGIYPEDRYKSVVNIGIDVVSHNKCINIAAEDIGEDDELKEYRLDEVDGQVIPIQTKSRITTLIKAILSLLCGASVQGVGQLEFTQKLSRFEIGKYGIWNNRNFEGMKIIMGTRISGVAQNWF